MFEFKESIRAFKISAKLSVIARRFVGSANHLNFAAEVCRVTWEFVSQP